VSEELKGCLVRKRSGKNNTLQPKPFKSGKKHNTVKDVVIHPILGVPAFSFFEDDSIVECSSCIVQQKVSDHD